MPTISVKKVWLDSRLEKSYSIDEFDELCFDYGLELDEVTTEKAQSEKEKGSVGSDAPADKNMTDELLYKIEVAANRYDLLCGEGVAQGLRVFLGKQDMPKYKLQRPKSNKLQRLIVKPEVKEIRPFVVAAILRDVEIDSAVYSSLIDLQEKLHQNLCRKRTLVAIGTHDLDTTDGPFVYTAIEPDKLKFKPLNQSQEYSAAEMMKLYSTDSHLRHYLHIIEDQHRYPVILDKNNIVLSMPPIINGDHSKIRTKTRNIFVEATATDLGRAKIVLDTLVTTMSEYCSQKFTIEPVEVQQIDGTVTVYPLLEYWNLDVAVSDVNCKIGINLNATEICKLLEKMCLQAAPSSDKEKVRVTVPPTRHDILHACDVIEDAAVAYGFNNLRLERPPTSTVGGQTPLNKLSDLLRHEIAQAGFTEALTFSLCSRDDIWSKLRQNPADNVVHIANPKTQEFQVARTTLLPGILKTICFNKDMPLPLKLFEIQDVVMKDDKSDVGAKNERRFCAVSYSKTGGFEVIHGLLDRFMELVSVPFGRSNNYDNEISYHIEACDDPTYFPGRCASIFGPKNIELGKLGVLHPEVLSAFELTLPCSALEINIELFL